MMKNNNTDDDKDHVIPLTTDTNGRQSDIYARFLEQMQRIEGGAEQNVSYDATLDDGAYEPLSEEELQMFADFNEQTAEIAARYDAEHPEEVAEENQPPPTFSRVEAGGFEDENAALACPVMTVEPPEPTPHPPQKKKPASKTSKNILRGLMLLVVGLISGVVISALAIFALDPDVLTTVTGNNDASIDNTPAQTVAQPAPAPAPAPAPKITPALTNTPAPTTNDTTIATDTVTQASNVDSTKNTDNSTTNAIANDTTDAPMTAAEKSALTYEDFQEEAQTTLYRDTSK